MATDSLEGSMLRSPWLTVCNVLWGNRLAASQHTVGSKLVLFSSLWPGEESFVELYNHGGMEASLYDIVKLLLTSCTFAPFDAMLSNHIISWDTKFPGNVTLTHLVCALSSAEGFDRLLRDLPQKAIWEAKDHLDRDPFAVCFSPNLRKHLRRNIKALGKHNKNPEPIKELIPEVKSQIFHLASEPEGLYDMAVLLQKYDFEVCQEKDSDGNLLLHVAASRGLPCLSHIFYLVRYYNADITIPNDQGLTPVHIAAMKGDEKMTEMLICVFGAGVNSTDTQKKWTPLHFAARYNCPQLINMLLERGADLRKDDCDGCIPALVAQKHSSGECLNLLEHHSKGRDERLIQQASEGTLDIRSLYPSDYSLVTNDGFTLLMKAVLGNQPALVRDLARQPSCPKDFKQFKLPCSSEMPSIQDQCSKTALTMAAESGLIECLRALLEAGADPTIEDSVKMLPLHYAVENNHKDCVKCILNYTKGLSGLKLAVSLAEKNGRGDIAHLIREAMHRRQKEVVTPALFETARNGNKDELFQLLEDGDDVNPSNDVSDWPLYVAAGFGHVEVVKLLYESGGLVTKCHRLNLCTPLHTAARGGHTEVIRFLLGFCRSTSDISQMHLDINEKNAMQETPLELAACQGHRDVVRLLLDHGAVTTLPDSNGCLLSCPAFCGIQFLIESDRKEQMKEISRYLTEQRPLKDFRTLWKGPSDFNLRDSHGDTVLMVAAKHAKPDVMDFLLQSAVLYTPDMKIKWNYNKRAPRPSPSSATATKTDMFEDSLPSELPSRKRDDYHDYRPQTALDHPWKPRRSSHGRHRRRGYATATDTSEDSGDLSSSGNYHGRYEAAKRKEKKVATLQANAKLRHEPIPPPPDAYVNVVLAGVGPCSQSGLLCLVNTYDRCSALHRAVEGDQFKLIPLLLAADPNIVNIQDKNGQSALHRACHQNLKKCIMALCNSSVVSIDPMLRDVNNKVAEELVIQPRLKKFVCNYRIKQVKESNPAKRPLPPAPLQQDSPPSNSNGATSLEPSDDSPLEDLNPYESRSHRHNQTSPLEDPYRTTELHTRRPGNNYQHHQVAPLEDHNPYESRSRPQGNNYQHHQVAAPLEDHNPYESRSRPKGNNYQHHQVAPLSPTLEEDTRQDDTPTHNDYQSHQPRYISNPRCRQAVVTGPNRRHGGRVQQVPVLRNGSVSDDASSYSRLQFRVSSPPPIPHQNFKPSNHCSSRNNLAARLRGVAYDTDSESD